MRISPLQLNTPDEILQLLARRLREQRLVMGWKQSTLATRSGVSLPTIRRFERTGQTSVKNLYKLCYAIGRLDEFAALLKQPPATSIAELEAQITSSTPTRKRGFQ